MRCLPSVRCATFIAVVMKKAGADRWLHSRRYQGDGTRYGLQGGLSFNLDAVIIPEEKEKLVRRDTGVPDEVIESCNAGLITNNGATQPDHRHLDQYQYETHQDGDRHLNAWDVVVFA